MIFSFSIPKAGFVVLIFNNWPQEFILSWKENSLIYSCVLSCFFHPTTYPSFPFAPIFYSTMDSCIFWSPALYFIFSVLIPVVFFPKYRHMRKTAWEIGSLGRGCLRKWNSCCSQALDEYSMLVVVCCFNKLFWFPCTKYPYFQHIWRLKKK